MTKSGQKRPDLAHNGRGGRCHCGGLGTFGYWDRVAWPRRLPDGSANVTSGALVWFCAAHRFGQCYADAVDGGER
ncbi:MAG TPA: hypothetical protein VKB89_04715 [Xanthobacteraceae bacterium]|nr:hypothetical protein [Xanthobacteraceae bacterium]